MKILHTADWHIGDFKGPVTNGENLRRRDIYNCLDFLYKTASEKKIDLTVISGDIFHSAKVWAERGLSEVSYIIEFLRKLAKMSKVCLLRGTPNHDGREQFNTIKMALVDNENIFIFDNEDIKKISTANGDICVAGISGFDKTYYKNKIKSAALDNSLIDKDLNKEQFFSEQIEKTILDLKSKCDENLPSILLLHHIISGCITESGKRLDLRNLDVAVDTKSLRKADFDMVLLGHIHRPQKINGCKNTFYSGAINALTFGDEGQERGFYIHEIDDDNFANVTSEFIVTPSRNFFTLKLDNTGIENFIKNSETIIENLVNLNLGTIPKINLKKEFKLLDSEVQEHIKDSIVRVVYSCTGENNANLNKSLLEKVLYRLGAFYVQEIVAESVVQSISKSNFLDSNSPVENLEKFLADTELKDSQIEESLEIAKPIIDEYLQNTQTTAMTGIFMPVELEVENYRSYRCQKFSYENINFTTVNGENGSGKSSLFMDAILDALYKDEAREKGGDISWLSNREGVKQGMIRFVFKIGDRKFCIVRRRKKKSSKAKKNPTPEVELYEWSGDDFKNISEDTNKQTEDKIKKIVGIEPNLLCSCGLIMQDKYGLFLEAESKDRMSTLCNILGLGIYDKLHDDIKGNVTDLNRDIKELKNKVEQDSKNDLLSRDIILEIKNTKKQRENLKQRRDLCDDKLKKLSQIESDKKIKSDAKGNYEKRILEKKQEIDKLNENEGKLKQQISGIKGEIEKLENNIAETDLLIAKAEKLKKNADSISREEEYNNLESNYELLKQKRKILEEKQKRYNELEKDISDKNGEKKECIAQIKGEIKTAETKLETARDKSKILDKTDCPIKESAKCSFLKDARENKQKIPELEENYNELKNKKSLQEKLFDEELELLESKKIGLGFSQNNLDEIKHQIEDLEKDIGEYKKELEEINSARQKKENYEERINDKQSQIEQLEKNIGDNEESLRKVNENLEEFQNELNKIEEKISEMNIQLEKNKKSDIQSELDKIEKQITKTNIKIGELKGENRQKEKLRQDLEGTKRELNQKSKQYEIYNQLKKSFSKEGIPHRIICNMIPVLENKASIILGEMTGGRMSIKFKTGKMLSTKQEEVPTLDVLIDDYQLGILPYSSKSGGERVKIALSIILALAEIKASTFGVQLGFLFIDEPPFLDEQGVQVYCDALETIKKRYSNLKIIAITHDQAMKARFSESIEVQKIKEEGSKIII